MSCTGASARRRALPAPPRSWPPGNAPPAPRDCRVMPSLATGALVDAVREARERTLALVTPLGDPDMERVADPLMSPLVWDLAHIAAYEDLWLAHRPRG